MRSIVFSGSVLLLFVLLQIFVSTVAGLVQVSPIKTAKHNQNKFISVRTACSKQAMMSVVVLRDPFHGVVYARGYPQECAIMGNGSREIRLTVGVNECGTKITEREDGSLQYDVLVYVQYDRHVQQAADELLLVQCSPQEVVVSGRMAPSSHQINNHKEFEYSTTSTSTPQSTIDAWMDILLGKMPNAVPITEHVNVGDDLTMLIKVRHAADMESRVTNCVASDGSNESQQELIDYNGCTIDPVIMPNLKEKYNSHTGMKVIHTTFQAFKFPERDNLHLQCRILLCNNTCPLESCHRGYSRQRTRFLRTPTEDAPIGNVVEEMNVFNSVEVKTPVVEIEKPHSKQAYLESAAAMASFQEELFCLSSTRMVAIIAVLLGVLLISLVITICMCVRARELRRRLIQRQSFPYGRVTDYS